MNSEVKKLFFPFIIFFIEWICCFLALQPTLETDTSLISFILFVINIFIICSLIGILKIDLRIKNLIYLSFFLRILIMLFDIYGRSILILPNSEGDAIWYHLRGVYYAFTKNKDIINFSDYSFYIGQLYKLIGVQKLTAQFLNVYFAILSICLIYNICKMMDISYFIIKKSMMLVCFLPNSLMIVSFFLYESLISFLIILSLYMFTVWWKNEQKIFLIFALLISAYAGVFHVGGIVVALGILLSYPIINNQDKIPDLSMNKMIKTCVCLLFCILFLSIFGSTYLKKVGGNVDIENISYKAEELYADGGSAYNSNVGGEGMMHFIINTPIRMIFFVSAPMPWMWRGIKDIIAFVGSALFYIYCWYIYYKVIKNKDSLNYKIKKEYIGYLFVVFIILIVSSIIFAWGVSNAGSALRHREKFTYLYIIMFAITNELMYRTSSNHNS